jgi:hypothetical protein
MSDKINGEKENMAAAEEIAEAPATLMDGKEVEAEQTLQTSAEDDPLEKYRAADGSINANGMLADLKQAEERLEGLRGKLSNPKGVTVEEMADELKAIDDEEDREFAEKFIGLLGKSGLAKEKANELLAGLGELQQKEDPQEFFRKEMEKLGEDGKELLGKVRLFRDTVRNAKEFSDQELATLEEITQTADGVRLVGKILEKAKILDSGKFSSQKPGAAAVEDLSNADRIRMYEKAFALKHTNPAESLAEVARLDRMFAR